MDLYSCTLKRKILFRGKPITQTWHLTVRAIDAAGAAAIAERAKPPRESYVIEDWPAGPIPMRLYGNPTIPTEGGAGIVSTWWDPHPRDVE